VPVVKDTVDQLVHSPVFVDSSGRRRSWVKWALGTTALVCSIYLVVLGFSLMGGPITPCDLLPWQGPAKADQQGKVDITDGGGSSDSARVPGSVEDPTGGTPRPVPGVPTTRPGVQPPVGGVPGTGAAPGVSAGSGAAPGAGSPTAAAPPPSEAPEPTESEIPDPATPTPVVTLPSPAVSVDVTIADTLTGEDE
jgi:hypothetical protein